MSKGNPFKTFFAFVIGSGIGAFVAQRYSKDYYLSKADEEIESVKKYYLEQIYKYKKELDEASLKAGKITEDRNSYYDTIARLSSDIMELRDQVKKEETEKSKDEKSEKKSDDDAEAD